MLKVATNQIIVDLPLEQKPGFFLVDMFTYKPDNKFYGVYHVVREVIGEVTGLVLIEYAIEQSGRGIDVKPHIIHVSSTGVIEIIY